MVRILPLFAVRNSDVVRTEIRTLPVRISRFADYPHPQR